MIKKIVVIISLIIVIAASGIVYSEICEDKLASSIYKGGGVRFYTDSHSFNETTGTYTLNSRMKNFYGISREVEYEWFVCRCKEADGNVEGQKLCGGYWPDMPYNGFGTYDEVCLGLGKVNITLAAYEEKNISMNTNSYRNESCGMFQVDLHLYRINGLIINNGLVSYGILGLCDDCEESYCGDGILDPGEECDDGNQINGDGCSADCKNEEDIFEFCEQFGCGWDCYLADWKNNEPEKRFPNDCIVVIIPKEGWHYSKCVPTVASDMCAN